MTEVGVRDRVGERAVVPILCALAAVAIGVATWRIVARDLQPAGWSSLVAGGLLVAAGLMLQPHDRLARVVVSFVDRAFDGFLLGSLAWVTRTPRPSLAAGALIALAAGFLASYIRAKGGSLGYGVEEGIVTPVIRYAAFALALLGEAAWPIWSMAVVNVLAAGVRASQVAKEERS